MKLGRHERELLREAPPAGAVVVARGSTYPKLLPVAKPPCTRAYAEARRRAARRLERLGLVEITSYKFGDGRWVYERPVGVHVANERYVAGIRRTMEGDRAALWQSENVTSTDGAST